jgi:hypothetical protein
MRISRSLIRHGWFGLLFVACTGLGAWGCTSDDTPDSGGAGTSATKLTSDVLFDGDELGRPQSVGIVGEWLLVGDRPQPTALHVIRRSNGDYLAGWGRQGRGPGEFVALWGIQAADSGSAWLYDPSQARLTLVSISGIVGDSRNPIRRTMNLESDMVPFTALWLSDTLLVSSGTYSTGRLASFDGSGRLKRVMGPLPTVREGIPPQVAQHAYSGTLVRHPTRPLLAIATRHADRVELYDADGRLLRVARGPRGFEPVFEVATSGGAPVMSSGGDMRFGYVDMAAAGEHLYALYSGHTRDELPGRANLGGEVHVFDWSGRLLRILPLDHLALALAVSDDARTLYTVRHDPAPAVLRTSLPAT